MSNLKKYYLKKKNQGSKKNKPVSQKRNKRHKIKKSSRKKKKSSKIGGAAEESPPCRLLSVVNVNDDGNCLFGAIRMCNYFQYLRTDPPTVITPDEKILEIINHNLLKLDPSFKNKSRVSLEDFSIQDLRNICVAYVETFNDSHDEIFNLHFSDWLTHPSDLDTAKRMYKNCIGMTFEKWRQQISEPLEKNLEPALEQQQDEDIKARYQQLFKSEPPDNDLRFCKKVIYGGALEAYIIGKVFGIKIDILNIRGFLFNKVLSVLDKGNQFSVESLENRVRISKSKTIIEHLIKEFLNRRTEVGLLEKIKDIFSESEKNLEDFIFFIKSQLGIDFSLTTTGFQNKTIKELIEILSFKIFKNINNIITSNPKLKTLFSEIDLNTNFGEKIVDEGYQPCYQEIISSPQPSETKTLRVILLPDQGHYLALIKD